MGDQDSAATTALERVLARIGDQMDLDVETELEVMAEIRDHFEQAMSEARAAGLDEAQALAQAADRFGVEEEVGRALQATHAGRSTADAVLATALPVICSLILRWLVFAPNGTALGWPQLLSRPAFWIVSVAALVIPLLKLERCRYALATWAVYWGLTVILVSLPAQGW